MLLARVLYVFVVGSNIGWTVIRVKHEAYRLPSPFASFPFTSPPVRLRVPSDSVFTIKLNSVALVRERTIPTERPPPVGEVSANFCG